MKPHHRRQLGRLLVVTLMLLIARALLPYAVKHYLNARMDKIGDYHGQIADIDLHLWRGAYTINGLRIVKTTGKLPAPLLDTPRADIQLSWFALSHGVFRGKVSFTDPTINFVEGHGSGDSQTGKGVDWRAQLRLLAPMRLDEVNVSNGTLTFQSFVSNPRVDLTMTDVNGTVTNLTNIQRRHGNRVAELHATAKVLDDAPFETRASFDPLSHFGDFSYQLHATNIQLVKANDLARAAIARLRAEQPMPVAQPVTKMPEHPVAPVIAAPGSQPAAPPMREANINPTEPMPPAAVAPLPTATIATTPPVADVSASRMVPPADIPLRPLDLQPSDEGKKDGGSVVSDMMSATKSAFQAVLPR